MIEHIALAIGWYCAVFFWWRRSVYLKRYEELRAKVDELLDAEWRAP